MDCKEAATVQKLLGSESEKEGPSGPSAIAVGQVKKKVTLPWPQQHQYRFIASDNHHDLGHQWRQRS